MQGSVRSQPSERLEKPGDSGTYGYYGESGGETCGFVDGMPVGAQLIGKPLGEETLLRAAYTFEQATEFHKAVAPLGGKK